MMTQHVTTRYPTLLCIISSFLITGDPSANASDNMAGDWPQYRGPNGDGISAETGILDSWPAEGPPEIWRKALGVGYSPVAVADGRLVTMDSGEHAQFAVCLDALTGTEIWRTKIGPGFTNHYGDGPRSCPTIDGGTVYVFGARGRLTALSVESGSEKWRLEVTERFDFSKPDYWFGFGSSPFVDGDMLLLNVGGSGNRSIAAINKHTGETIWTAHSDSAAYSTPIAVDFHGTRQYVFTTARNVVSLSPSGKINWRYPWGGNIIKVAMPVFVPPDKIFASASYGIGAVLLKLPARAGEPVGEVWVDKVMNNHFNSSVLLGDYLYGFDNGTLKCIEAATAKEMWAKRRLGKGSLIYADGKLIVLSDRGLLVLLDADSHAYVERSRYQVLTGRCWTPPTLANGRLYLRNQEELVALDLRK